MRTRSKRAPSGLCAAGTSSNLAKRTDLPLTPSPTTLTDLPIELIEHIADDARYYDSTSELPYFIVRNEDVSSLSQTCSFIRKPVERILYRHIQLNFTLRHKLRVREILSDQNVQSDSDWNSSDDSISSDYSDSSIGSGNFGDRYGVFLLLRTLNQRPDLRIYVRDVVLDLDRYLYPELGTNLSRMRGAMVQLFKCCPRLRWLVMLGLPPSREIAKLSNSHVNSLACDYHPSRLPAMMGQFPSLRELYCADFGRSTHRSSLSVAMPDHHITDLQFDCGGESSKLFFIQALEFCTISVQKLVLVYIGDEHDEDIDIPHLDPNTGRSLVTLCGNGLDILNSTEAGEILYNLPALQHLQLAHHPPLAPDAFMLLPQGLRSLAFSFGICERDDCIRAFIHCLQSPAWRVRRVVQTVAISVKEPRSTEMLSNLQSLRQFCGAQGIVLGELERDSRTSYGDEIKITFE